MTPKQSRSTYRAGDRKETFWDRLGSKRRTLAIIGLVLFLIADVVLVGLALTANGRSTEEPTQRPIPTFGGTPSATASPEVTEEPVAAESTERFMAAGNATVLWRATQGTCEVPAVVERSEDAGVTWAVIPTAQAFDLRVVYALTATSEDEVQLVGSAGSECAVGGFSSTDAGDTWDSSPELLSTVAYQTPLAPDGSTAVVMAGQPVAAPCPVVEVLAADETRTVTACSAVLAEWDASNGSWTAIPFAGIHAVELQPDQILFAARGVTGCTGLGVLRVPGATLTATSAPEEVSCIADADLAAPAALTSADGVSWLWVGETLFSSSDGGVSWASVGS
ncbi:hypothetical protein EAO79_18555 [Plantibacter sp. PA-3-X8]|uniref:hypothetical protein n=1 Tax=Plantibacter sp. PA-3-X8 TaxID=2480625 RepID=UPI000F5DAF3C|nr:hypothetical protein [Plantibacter sp. PA-3-X8]AZH84676.1 hypothetical protein EAO79_18555 [Plantibacter sp. PA-3-X8]